MIYGIGVDTVSLERFESALKDNHRKFIQKICHKNEIRLLSKNKNRKTTTVAGAFACKEALAKAFGTGLGVHMWFTDIEVKKNGAGAPFITLHGKAKKIKEKFKIKKIFVSLTHEARYCTAFVILEK